MNVAVLSGLNATDPDKKDDTTQELGWWAKTVAWMKANPGKTGLAIGSVIALIFLIWWFNRKPKRKRTSGLAKPKTHGTKKKTGKQGKKSKSKAKKKAVNGLNGLSESEMQRLVGLAKAPKKPTKSTKKKTTTKKRKS